MPRARLRESQVERQVLAPKHGAPGEHDRALDDVLHLADVARPVVAREDLERAGRHPAHVAVELARVLGEEVVDEQGDVVAPLAERGDRDGHDVEPVVEVLAEPALAHGLPEVDVGGGDHAHVYPHRPAAAEALDLAFLKGAEELGLQVEAEAADLVQEERAAVCELEPAGLLGEGTGEGALLVAEQLALHERLGEGGDVDGDERPPGSGALLVDGARDELLAGAALARHQDGGRRRRDLRDELVDPRHLHVAADHRVDAPRQRRPEVEHLALEGALVEGPANQQLDVLDVEGLGDVVVGAALDGLDGGADLVDGGGEHDHDRRVERLDAAQHVDAGLARHPLVEHHHVDLVPAQDLERLLAVLRLEHGALILEKDAEGRAHALLVVDDQHRPAPRRRLEEATDHGAGFSSTRYSLTPPSVVRWT